MVVGNSLKSAKGTQKTPINNAAVLRLRNTDKSVYRYALNFLLGESERHTYGRASLKDSI